jgi:hypothetical protein
MSAAQQRRISWPTSAPLSGLGVDIAVANGKRFSVTQLRAREAARAAPAQPAIDGRVDRTGAETLSMMPSTSPMTPTHAFRMPAMSYQTRLRGIEDSSCNRHEHDDTQPGLFGDETHHGVAPQATTVPIGLDATLIDRNPLTTETHGVMVSLNICPSDPVGPLTRHAAGGNSRELADQVGTMSQRCRRSVDGLSV